MSSKKIWYAPNKKEAYGELEIKAVLDCLNDGWLAGFGPKTIEFEEKISILFGKNVFCIGILIIILFRKL